MTCPPDWLDYFIKRIGFPTAGLIGAEALDHFRIGIDYIHKTVYFLQRDSLAGASFDLIGLTLRPGADGHYSVLGVSEYKGRPSVNGVMKGDILVKVNNRNVSGLTMGKIWSLLSGPPGAVYSLVVSRGGKTLFMKGKVCHFLDQ